MSDQRSCGVDVARDSDRRERTQPRASDDLPESLTDMQGELRILLPGIQLLTAFLVLLPFQGEFAKIQQVEKWIYLATFLCSISSLILFSAPAAQHRLERPLRDRERFKDRANRVIVLGLVLSSLTLILATQLVVSEVSAGLVANLFTAVVALLIAATWWLMSLVRKARERGGAR